MLANAIAAGDASLASDDLDESIKNIINSLDENGDGIVSNEEKIKGYTAITRSGTEESDRFTRALKVQAEMFKESEQKAAEYTTSLKKTNKELALAGELAILMGSMENEDGIFSISAQDQEGQEAFIENLQKMGTGMRRLITGGGSVEEMQAQVDGLADAGEDVVKAFYDQVAAAQLLVKQIAILKLTEQTRLKTMQRQAAVFKSMEKKKCNSSFRINKNSKCTKRYSRRKTKQRN